jgi:uncharacterized protein (DUF1810 family)
LRRAQAKPLDEVHLPATAWPRQFPAAQFCGIGSLDEARAYLAHPVLGSRLRECVRVVLDCGETDPGVIFGSPDDMKFISSMTLFSLAAGEGDTLFAAALAKFSHGDKDERTLTLLAS